MDVITQNIKKCIDYFNETGNVHPESEKYINDYNQFVSHNELKTVCTILKKDLDLQKLSDMLYAVKQHCVGDGCGLKSGTYIDDIISEYFSQNILSYRPFFSKEADMKICNVPMSLKSCTNTKGTQFALNWSKNKNVNVDNFLCHVMIIVSTSGMWWKNKKVMAGIYLIDKHWCRNHVLLSSNNKTDKLIPKPEVYKMIQNSSYFIEIPEPRPVLKFNILKAFSDQT